MRLWCAAALDAVSSFVTITETYDVSSRVRGIQKCGSLSIFAVFCASSVLNSLSNSESISLDIENDPKLGPTPTTLPNDARSPMAVSYETFSTCAASPASLTVISPYLSRPFATHSCSSGMGPICARMSAWCAPESLWPADGTKIWSPQNTDRRPARLGA